MRRVALLRLVGTSVATVVAIAPAPAQADVQRNQITTYTYNVTYLAPGGLDFRSGGQLSFSVACGKVVSGGGTNGDGTVALTNLVATPPTGVPAPLTFTATTTTDEGDGYVVQETSSFVGQWAAPGFYGTVTGDNFPPGDVDQWIEQGNLASTTTSQFSNHGAFVSSAPASLRNAAATSCIGMPVQTQN